MAKTISISVPDELHEKMQKYKNDFNFSRIFQTTMGDLIENKENFQKRITEGVDMNETIERLRQEKTEYENELFEDGKNDGLKFANSASYSDLVKAVKLEAEESISGMDFSSHAFHSYFLERAKEYQIEFLDDWNVMTFEFEQWFHGWKEGVVAFWEEIEDKL